MSIFRNSIIYLGSEIFNKSIPFLLLPVLTEYLSPEEFGIYSLYQVLISFLTPLISMSLDTNISRNFFRVDEDELAKIVNSILLILHINLLIGLVLVFIVTNIYGNIFNIPKHIFELMPVIIFTQTINGLNLTILKNRQEAIKYGFFQIVNTIIKFVIAIGLLLYFHFSWNSLVYGTLVANLVVLFFSILNIVKIYRIGVNFYPFKTIYVISIPLIFHLMGEVIIFFSDRLFIKHMLDLESVGIYSISYQFGYITMLFIHSISLAIEPLLFRQLAKHQDIKKISFYFMVVFLIGGLVIWQVTTFIFPYLIDERYIGAVDVIPWIVSGFVIRGWEQIVRNVIVYKGKTGFLVLLTIFNIAVNLILNYYLISLNGITGAPQATLIMFSISFIATLSYVKYINTSYTKNIDANQ